MKPAIRRYTKCTDLHLYLYRSVADPGPRQAAHIFYKPSDRPYYHQAHGYRPS